MKRFLALTALVAAPLVSMMAPAEANALTKVAQINGCYDCVVYDTPALQIQNTTGGTMTNISMTLYGYQGLNNGITQVVSLGDISDATTSTFVWGSLPGVPSSGEFNLTSYDYDDEYGGDPNYQIPTTDCGYPGIGCVDGGGPYWYAQPGNFQVTISAIISGGAYDGQHVFSQFTPASNATGGFVGWEGLDAPGFSESPYDIHSGGFTNDLADIYLGDAPPPGVPEPSIWALMIGGVAMTGASRSAGMLRP